MASIITIINVLIVFIFCMDSAASGTVFLVKKNGGTDDGTLYALKAIDISYALYYDKSRPLKTLVEREVN